MRSKMMRMRRMRWMKMSSRMPKVMRNLMTPKMKIMMPLKTSHQPKSIIHLWAIWERSAYLALLMIIRRSQWRKKLLNQAFCKVNQERTPNRNYQSLEVRVKNLTSRQLNH
jgi:hypothetical protein